MKNDPCCQPRKKRHCSFSLTVIIIPVIILALILIFVFFSTPASLNGFQAQQNNAGNTILPDGETIVFNSVLNNQSPNISYDAATGIFTITKSGNYYVSWWVTTDGSSAITNVSFSIAVNGTPYSLGCSPIVSGQVNGSDLITVGSTPTTIELINNSTDDLLIAPTPVQANIVIVEVNP